MLLKHIGKWRGIEPTGTEISAVGCRYVKLADNKIIEHWALIDGKKGFQHVYLLHLFSLNG
jgi:hypothetical protein